MSISQKFIALFERVRNVAELIKRAFFSHFVVCMLLYLFFGLPHKDLWAAVFLLFGYVVPFHSFGHRHFLAFITFVFGCAKHAFFFLSFSYDCMYSDLCRRESNNRFLFITTLFEKRIIRLKTLQSHGEQYT